MYMTRRDVVEFEWDKGNIDKNYRKHGISPNEAEEVFLDEWVAIKPDFTHSRGEDRFIAIGTSSTKQILFIIFTLRNSRVRIISARVANKKERSIYENEKT